MIATGMSKKFSHIPASAFLMDLDNSEHAASLGTYKRSNSVAVSSIELSKGRDANHPTSIPITTFVMGTDNSAFIASLEDYKRSGNSFATPTKAATKAATVEDNQELIKNIERSQREAEDLEGKIFNAQGEAYEREAKQIMGDYYESARV